MKRPIQDDVSPREDGPATMTFTMNMVKYVQTVLRLPVLSNQFLERSRKSDCVQAGLIESEPGNRF